MTPPQIAMFIIKRWRLEHSIDAIMVALYRAGHPLAKTTILKVIRTYVNASSENNGYRGKASRSADRRKLNRRDQAGEIGGL
ncbi:hypothetical protein [Methylocystis echinoides]|jgi:hypothetical protein|uniref:hypothetical protein n=1 Tax=Methylocystis echinoides TaxID=29468 RepID=UPI0034437732